MNKVLSKKVELSKSDKFKISVLVGFIVGLVSMVIYNSLVYGTVSYFLV
jgi:hypothetical protein